MVLSQSQREALAAFITNFPNTATTEADPVIPCPIVEVDRSFWTSEEQAEEPLPVFDAPLPAGVVAEEPLPVFNAPLPPGVGEFSSPVGIVGNVLTMPAPAGGPSQVDPPFPHPAASMVDNSKVVVAASNLDKNGLPWDDRIHAGSKAKTQDGSWRTKRGVDAGLLAAVQAELRGIMGLPAPVARIETTPFPPQPPTDPALTALLAASIPPPPVVPAAAVPSITSSPVVSAPTVAPAVSPAPFISLVSFAGAKSLEGKLSDAEIEAACKTVGVNSLTLMTNRHDLCPFVEASLRQLVASR